MDWCVRDIDATLGTTTSVPSGSPPLLELVCSWQVAHLIIFSVCICFCCRVYPDPSDRAGLDNSILVVECDYW